MKCEKHPEFDPKNEEQFKGRRKYLDCPVCCGLHYGVKPIGEFPGERVADQHAVDTAKVVLGPMNLEQFGHARYSFSFDYHMSDGATWSADAHTKTIYFGCEMSETVLKNLDKKYKCRAAIRKWSEPVITALETSKNEDGVVLYLCVGGHQNGFLKLSLNYGMTVEETRAALMQLSLELYSIPKIEVVEAEL